MSKSEMRIESAGDRDAPISKGIARRTNALVSERGRRPGALSRCAISVAAMMLAIMGVGPAHGDVVKSDTVAIDFAGIKESMDAPEVVVDGKESGESKLVFDLARGVGFIGKDGYILLCEPPMNRIGGCGPRNKFKGVSDILAKGKLAATRGPALFFFSGPFSVAAPDDAMATLKELFRGNPIPNPLGPIDGILETGQAQEVGKLFGFDDNKAIIITSDDDPKPMPEPGSIILFATGTVLAAASRLRRRSAAT